MPTNWPTIEFGPDDVKTAPAGWRYVKCTCAEIILTRDDSGPVVLPERCMYCRSPLVFVPAHPEGSR